MQQRERYGNALEQQRAGFIAASERQRALEQQPHRRWGVVRLQIQICFVFSGAAPSADPSSAAMPHTARCSNSTRRRPTKRPLCPTSTRKQEYNGYRNLLCDMGVHVIHHEIRGGGFVLKMVSQRLCRQGFCVNNECARKLQYSPIP